MASNHNHHFICAKFCRVRSQGGVQVGSPAPRCGGEQIGEGLGPLQLALENLALWWLKPGGWLDLSLHVALYTVLREGGRGAQLSHGPTLRQQIDGLQARHLEPASCSWGEKKMGSRPDIHYQHPVYIS